MTDKPTNNSANAPRVARGNEQVTVVRRAAERLLDACQHVVDEARRAEQQLTPKEDAGEYVSVRSEDYRHLSNHPQECPITGKAFFMVIEHPERGLVATYGGPHDSFTIPERRDDGDLVSERYDHDRGAWVGRWSVGLVVTPEGMLLGQNHDHGARRARSPKP